MTFDPTQNRIQTMHLTADELAAMGAAQHGWEYFSSGAWVLSSGHHFAGDLIYRAKPAPVTQDVVPWEAIDARWHWCARDENGARFFYAREPHILGNGWDAASMAQDNGTIANITPGTCDWRDSLQQRPQPAATGAVTEPLAVGTRYWVADVCSERFRGTCTWDGEKLDHTYLSRGLIHLTEASAVAAAKRMTGGV